MPSTHGSDRPSWGSRYGGALILIALFGLAALFISRIPGEPEYPRYLGAGDPTPRAGGTFEWTVGSAVRTLDPHIAYDTLSFQAVRLVYDGLLDYDYEGNLIPSLAAALPEPLDGGLSFRFTLRKGVRFHDGTELNAEVVSFSFHEMLSKSKGSPGYGFFKILKGAEAYHRGEAERIEGIVVEGTHLIRFDLEERDQTFLNAIALPFAYPVSPKNIERFRGDRAGLARSPVGTGPFIFEDWERGVKLSFKRNGDYFEPNRANPDSMVMWENVDGTTAARRFRNGDIDILAGAPKVHLLFFRESPAWRDLLILEPSVTLFGLAMNCEIPPLDNVHVRRAIAAAIDRQAISDFMLGLVKPTGQPIPPQLKGYDPELPTEQRFDPERAREELRLAGYPDGLSEPIEVWIGEGEGSRNLAQLWQSDLAEVGIPIRLKQVAFSAYLVETAKEKTVPMFVSGWMMDFPDPSNFLDVLFSSKSIHPVHSENRSFYRNAELDDLLDRARGEIDQELRTSLYGAANEIVARDAPWAFLYNSVDFVVVQPYVMNYRHHPVWANEYRGVWLDLPRRAASEADFPELVSARDRAHEAAAQAHAKTHSSDATHTEMHEEEAQNTASDSEKTYNADRGHTKIDEAERDGAEAGDSQLNDEGGSR